MITTTTVVHIVLDENNDPMGEAGRYIAQQMNKGVHQSDIVKKAWAERFMPVPDTAPSPQAVPFAVTDFYYDPAVAPDGAEQEVIDVIIDASKR